MVYSKYVERNGKLFGPYYYTSIRKNGRVKSVFLGKNFKNLKQTGAIALQKFYNKIYQKEQSEKASNAQYSNLQIKSEPKLNGIVDLEEKRGK